MRGLLVAVGFVLGLTLVAAPAEADEWGPWNITDPASVCVRTDFPATGSGWKVQKAIANWNSVQTTVHFVMGDVTCSDVVVHRYAAEDGRCGRTDFIRLWDQAHVESGVVFFAGADVYLNDNCTPDRAMRKTVVAHELGHAIGLVHTYGNTSVMSPSYLASVYKGVPGPADVRALSDLYGQ